MCTFILFFLSLPLVLLVWKKYSQWAGNNNCGCSTQKVDDSNDYAKWYNYRENLLKKSHPLTQDILTKPKVAEREFNYWIECLCNKDPQVALWFLLNVCEKVEYENPMVVMAMRDAVCSSTRNDYDIMKDRLYRLFHGETL